MVALSITDDELMTERGTRVLIDCYENAPRQLQRIAPADVGAQRIGHFGFFRAQFEPTLWRRLEQLLAGFGPHAERSPVAIRVLLERRMEPTSNSTLRAASPDDGTAGTLIGRCWLPGAHASPAVVAVREQGVFDLSERFTTVSDLLDEADPARAVKPLRATASVDLGPTSCAQHRPRAARPRRAASAGADATCRRSRPLA